MAVFGEGRQATRYSCHRASVAVTVSSRQEPPSLLVHHGGAMVMATEYANVNICSMATPALSVIGDTVLRYYESWFTVITVRKAGHCHHYARNSDRQN